MDYQSYLARIVKDATGMDIDEVRRTPLCELRRRFCGNDLYAGLRKEDRKYVLTSEEITRSLDLALAQNS